MLIPGWGLQGVDTRMLIPGWGYKGGDYGC